jgi:hypothetical protein
MSQAFNSVISFVDPGSFAADMGLTILSDSTGVYTTCPCGGCNGKLYITDEEFVCDRKNCKFRAGGVLDYMAVNADSYDSG